MTVNRRAFPHLLHRLIERGVPFAEATEIIFAAAENCDTPMGDWIRSHPQLDSIKERLCVVNSDYWIHQYRAHHDRVGARAVDSIMCIEATSYCKDLAPAKRDTLVLVDQALRATDKPKMRSYRRFRGPHGEQRIVRLFGVMYLQMSGNRPDNSEEMLWSGRKIDIDTLVELLRFERDPNCISRRLEFRRHHTASWRQTHLDLFREAAE